MEIVIVVIVVLALLAVIGVILQPTNKPAPQDQVIFTTRTKKLIQEEEPFEVGKVTLEYTFENKKKFISTVYGEVHTHNQWFEEGRDGSVYHGNAKEPSVGQIQTVSAKNKALGLLYSNSKRATVVDDEKNPTVSYSGKVLSVKFLKEEPHIENRMVFKVKVK